MRKRYACEWVGCPVVFVEDGKSYQAHVNKKHFKCPGCGKYFTSRVKHGSQMKRWWGPGHPCAPPTPL